MSKYTHKIQCDVTYKYIWQRGTFYYSSFKQINLITTELLDQHKKLEKSVV